MKSLKILFFICANFTILYGTSSAAEQCCDTSGDYCSCPNDAALANTNCDYKSASFTTCRMSDGSYKDYPYNDTRNYVGKTLKTKVN